MPSASGSLMNETRSTRIVALLAGNGFFLAKLGEHWLTEGHRLLPSIMPLVIIALLGVSLAYISLFGRLQKRWPIGVGGNFCHLLSYNFRRMDKPRVFLW